MYAPGMELRANLSAWWSALVPEGLSHRALLLGALDRMAVLLRAVHSLIVGVANTEVPCWVGQGLVLDMMDAYKALEGWGAVFEESGSAFSFFHLGSLGEAPLNPAGVVHQWAGEVGRTLFSQSWMPMLACGELGVLLEGALEILKQLARTQFTWPWLVDTAAVAGEAGVAVVAPMGTLTAESDGEVLCLLIAALQVPAPLAVEVGVDRGATSEVLLQAFPSMRLVGIDPYLGNYGGIPSSERVDGLGASARHAVASAIYNQHGQRAQLVRLRGAEAARNWSAGPIDLVFIDAEHDIDSCIEDIRSWLPLLRSPGGVLAGDDYLAGGGVPSAVHTVLPAGVQLNVAPNGVWWWVQS